MSIEKIKKPLEKILDRLSTLEEKGKLPRLDRDHIGDLLIQAYDELVSDKTGENPQAPKAGKHEIFEFEEDNPAPEHKPKQEVAVQEAEENKPAPKPEQSVSKKDSTEEAEAPQQKEQEVAPSNDNQEVSSDLESLFQIKESTELSERLSQLPISDIWNAMGLNERIFTQNELFDGDHEAFQSTVQKLNKLSDFQEAKKELMSGAAKKYDWASGDRKNIAKNFIRLVKRRYK